MGYGTAGLLTLVSVAACSGGTGSAGSQAVAHGDVARAHGRAGAAGAEQPGAPARLAPSRQDKAVTASVVTEAKIRTAQLTVAVAKAAQVAGQADRAAQITIGVGGEVDSDDRVSGPAATAEMQFRVPPARLRSVLAQLAALGKEKSRALSTTDVSERVADVDSRVQSARDAIARLRVLYSSATKIGEIITVEGELSSREADLESLEAQQRTLARQTAMAVITLTLQTAPKTAVAKPHTTHKHHSGFVGGLHRGWDGFVAAGNGVATGFGTLLPFLVLILVLGVAGRVAWRRIPRRTGPGPSPAPAE
ncbi:MAG: DUF4349 domain-containing protein [Jatrophihabitans sp.]|uniref:DUF4349 domain-containing protein n=1 Tax=Jatrophihabitans sp. TaxID=1932789 RepID=UPI003913F10B